MAWISGWAFMYYLYHVPPARAAGFSRRVGGTVAIGTVEIGSYGARVPLEGI